MMRTSAVRLFVLGLCFFGATAAISRSMRSETPRAVSLDSLPNTVASWTGGEAPFAPDVIAALGVDAYVHRIYSAPADPPVSLYVGYYESQRTGDTIHSPQNCLPGAGWLPVTTERVDLDVPGRAAPVTINRVLIQKGLERQIVLYWYQSRGRVVASDYWSKIYLVYDAARHHRSDAAMVRVITPITGADRSERDADARAEAFVRAMFPDLDRLLPS